LVGLQTLNLAILVRVQASQPNFLTIQNATLRSENFHSTCPRISFVFFRLPLTFSILRRRINIDVRMANKKVGIFVRVNEKGKQKTLKGEWIGNARQVQCTALSAPLR
jgi:hypothetical protein